MFTPKTICNRIMGCVIRLILIILAVAFFTFMERKILGYIHIRKGPNKPRPIGITVPFADAVKLFSKELNVPFLSNYYLFLPITIIIILTPMLLWAIPPLPSSHSFHPMSMIIAIAIIRIGVYGTLWPGWINRKYSLLEAVHAKSQTISYEVSITIPFFIQFRIFEKIFCYFAFSINLYIIYAVLLKGKKPHWLLILLIFLIDFYFLGFIDCSSYWSDLLKKFK